MINKEKVKINPRSGGTYNKKGRKVNLKTGFQTAVNRPNLSPKQERVVAKTSGLSKHKMFIGAWKEGGKISTELSAQVKTKEEAKKLAYLTNQKAIFDNRKGKVINNPLFRKNTQVETLPGNVTVKTTIVSQKNLQKFNQADERYFPNKRPATRREITSFLSASLAFMASIIAFCNSSNFMRFSFLKDFADEVSHPIYVLRKSNEIFR